MSARNQPVQVIVCDDHPMYREGVARALSSSGRVQVLAQAANGREALDAIREHQPDVAVLDHRMPELDGVQVARAAARDGMSTKVLILSAFTSSQVVYDALEAGVAGYLPKEALQNEIIDAVLAVARGENVLPPALAGGVFEQIRMRSGEHATVLTEREAEVLALIAQGKSIPAIAKELILAPTTVKSHAASLYEKLGVSDRAAAVAEAMRRGLLE